MPMIAHICRKTSPISWSFLLSNMSNVYNMLITEFELDKKTKEQSMSNLEFIPEEYKELNQSTAAKLAGLKRMTFIRKYWKSGLLQISTKDDGTEYITFENLYNEFKETATQNLLKLTSGQGEFAQEQDQSAQKSSSELLRIKPTYSNEQSKIHALELEIAKLDGEKEKYKALLEKSEDVISEQREQIQKHLSVIERSQMLLEDKTSKADQLAQQIQQEAAQKTEDAKRIEALEKEKQDALAQLEQEQSKGFWSRLFGR